MAEETYEAPQLIELGEACDVVLGGDQGSNLDADHVFRYSIA